MRSRRVWYPGGCIALLLCLGPWTAGPAPVELPTPAESPPGTERPLPSALRIAGSDSMAPFLRSLGDADGFELDARGSSTGAAALLRGEAELASLTRPLSETERAAFRARHGREPLSFAIGLDAVVLWVNARNPLERLDRSQIESIFAAAPRCSDTEPIEHWDELGGPLTDGAFVQRDIGIYAPPATSGTRALFRSLALCQARLTPRTREQPGTRSVAQSVAASRYAIGVGSLGGATPEVRALALPATDGRGDAAPRSDEVRSGRYPFARELLLAALPGSDGRLPPRVRAFLEKALSDPSQTRLAAMGFVSLPEAALARERERLSSLPR